MGRPPGWVAALTGRAVMRSPGRPPVRRGPQTGILVADRQGSHQRGCCYHMRRVGTGRHTVVGISKPLVRADSAFFGYPAIGAAICGRADVSITTGLNSAIRSAISTISDEPGHRSNTPTPPSTNKRNGGSRSLKSPKSRFTAFTSQKKAHHVPGRLIVRRILWPSTAKGSRTTPAVRRVEIPRVLHHHRPGRT